MSRSREQCASCNVSFRELERDRRGDLLCVDCYSDRYPSNEPEPDSTFHAVSSWAPVPLAQILAGGEPDERPELMRRTDGIGLFYRGRIHSLGAEPESGKGWAVLHACRERVDAGDHVVYIDHEDTAANIAARLLALDMDPALVLERFHYVRPEDPITDASLAPLLELEAALVVIDGVTEALALEGLDMASNQDIAEFYKRCARPFSRAGAAVALVDHVVKDREARGRYAIGAQHKLAGVDVAYRLDVAQPFGRGREGLVKVTVTKDRPGHVRQHAVDGERIALMRLTSTAGGNRVTVALEPPETAGAAFRPTVLMERVSRAVEAEPGMSKRALREAVRGKSSAVDLALECLIAEGYVDARRDGQSLRHYSVTAFDNPDRDHRDPPCPDRVPDTRDPVTPCLYRGTGLEDTPDTVTVPPSGNGHLRLATRDEEALIARHAEAAA